MTAILRLTTGIAYVRSISGTLTFASGSTLQLADGTTAAPSLTFANETGTGFYRAGPQQIGVAIGGSRYYSFLTTGFQLATTGGITLVDDAANTLALKNGVNGQTFREYGYSSGSRLLYTDLICVTTAVTLSGATSGTGNVIPAGAEVVGVATTTTTTITGASGYTVGDGTDADRYGDITGTAVGTATGSTAYTADPRWWANTARAITLTAKTSNFTGGVVQVTVFYRTATGA